jgi:RHS repeat-associated protein
MANTIANTRPSTRRRVGAAIMAAMAVVSASTTSEAATSALGRLPESTVQSLRGSFGEVSSPLRASLHHKLDDLQHDVERDGSSDAEAKALNQVESGDKLRNWKNRFAGHRAEIKQLREQHAQELLALKRQVQQLTSTAAATGGDKAAIVQNLADQLDERFARLDAALAQLESAKDAKEHRAAARKLQALLKALQPAETVPSGPVPMLSPAHPNLRRPSEGGVSRTLPKYALEMLHDEQFRQAQAGKGLDNAYASNGFGFVKVAITLPPVAPDATTDCSSTSADLADDGVEVRLTPEIQALAKSLQYSPTRILRWMLKEVEYEPYWGSMKGSLGVLQSRRGNATDQSSLLVALLRASNIPARFVRGTVSLDDLQPSDSANGRVQRWLGTKSYSASMAALGYGGVAAGATVNASGAVQGVNFDHVWVQACVPYAGYRGSKADSGGYRWLPMDPSIKDHDYQDGLSVSVTLDDAFYSGYLAKRTDQLMTDYLGDKVEAAARSVKSDASREDVPYLGRLRGLKVDVLPSNIPAAVRSFSNWSGTGSPESSTIPDGHRHKFTVTVQNAGGTTLASKTLTFPQNVFSKVTVSYLPDSASQSLWNSWGGSLSALPSGTVNVYPQIKADGVVVASGSGSATMALNAQHKLIMKVTQGEQNRGTTCVADTGNPSDAKDTDTTCLNKTVYTNLAAGSYFALGINARQASDPYLESLAKTLAQGVSSNTTPPTPASGAAYDATVGQLLHLVLQSYVKGIVDADADMGASMGFKSAKNYDLGLTGAQLKTDYAFDLPLTVKPAGVYVDFKGGVVNFIKLNSTAPTKANSGESTTDFNTRRKAALRSESTPMNKLSIYSGSTLEHRVWQEALRTDAVSTVRGLQYASETGTTLVTFTSSNIAQYDSLMDSSMASYKASITSQVSGGATVTVPRAKIAYTDPVDTNKAWRGAVYFTVNDTAGAYGAIIEGGLSGGYPLINPAPITTVYTPPVTLPSFQSVVNTPAPILLSTLTPGVQGSNSFATWVGDPVNMLTGNFTHHESDLRIKGRGGLPILLERWYNSGDPKDGPFGYGWTHSFNHQIKLYGIEGSPSTAKVSWVNGSGGEQYFTTTSHTNGDITKGALFTNPAGVEVQFSRVSGGADDGKFKIRERDGTVYLFASTTGPSVTPSATSAVTARLLSITDRNGNTLTLNYNGTQLSTVTDSLSRTVLTFTWTGSHVTQVSDFTGRKVIYAYTDGNNNLNQVTDALSQNHGYSYYTSADGTKLDHHLKRYTLPRGNGMEFAYYSGGQVFRHTPFGTDSSLIDASATTFHYNLFNRESWSVNGRGYEHHITFDANGNPLKIVEENGAIHTYTYDSANPYNRLTDTDSIGRTTKYTYTTGAPKNLVETITRPSGAVVEFRDYNSFAQPQKLKDERGNWTWQKFDANGNLTDSIKVKSGVTPVAGTQPAAADTLAWTKLAYDSVGNVTTTTRVKDFSAGTGPSLTQNWDTNKLNVTSLNRKGNRNGATVDETTPTFTYDTLGRQKTGVDARWYPASYDYDALDRLILATDGYGKTRKFGFDANSNPNSSELIDAGARQDASSARFDGQDRLLDTLDYAGNRSFFSYDEVGNRLTQTSPDNFTLSFDYDEVNHPVAAFDAEGNRVYTRLDTQGRPLSVTDPNGNVVSYQYWGASGSNFTADGRLKRVTQPKIAGQSAGRAVEYDYDNAGNVIHTRALAADGSSTRQSYSFYDELGRVTRKVGAPDDAGNRLQICSKFDNLSNLTEVWAGPTTDTSASTCNFSDANLKKQVAYTWDDFGQQLSRTDQLGKSWSFAYDYYGNLQNSQTPEQAKVSAATKTSYAYDPGLNGALKTRTVPGTGSAGQTATYTRNALGQVTRAETKDGSGTLLVAYDYGYDTAHRLTSIADSRGNKSLGYEWTPGGRLSKITLKDAGTITHQWDFKYDAVGRPTAVVAPNGQTVTFTLDAAGRLIERNAGAGLTTQYNWLPEGSLSSIVHMAQALSTGGQVGNAQTAQLAQHAYTYDIWGNRATSADTLAGSTYNKSYTYDALNRIKTVSNGTAAQQEGYGFDIFGNLSSKTIGSPATQSWTYTVDDAHQLKQVQQGTTTSAYLRYDDNGNLKKLCEGASLSGTATDCSGSTTTTYSWDGLDEMVALARAGTNALNEAYAYDEAGRRIKKTSAGTTSHYLYDSQDIVAEWTGASLSGTPAAAYVHGGGTDDPVLRLTGASGTPDATSNAYAQDGIGNATALLEMSSTPANQMQVAGNTLATTGDADAAGHPGSQLKDGVTAISQTTGWVGYTANGAAATLTLGSAKTLERVEIDAVRNYLPSTYVVEALSGSTWVQVASGTNADFTEFDGSSVRAIKSFAAVSTTALRVRFTGAVNSGVVWLTELEVWSTNGSSTQRFDAWGNPAGSTGSSIPTYGFTGREPDASGLVAMRARYYSPQFGRFISRDPIGLASGISPYQYADGNPISNNDPSGLIANSVSNTVTNYAGQVSSWAGNNNLGTRALGGLQLAGGVAEFGLGGSLGIGAGWTGVGAVGAVGLMGLGADQASAGLQTMLTGNATPSLVNRGLQGLGATPTQAAWGDALINVTATGGASSLLTSGNSFAGTISSGGAATSAYAGIGSTGKIGETALKALGGESQVYFPTSQGARFVDQLVGGVAHESKVGYTSLTKDVSAQIAKDVELMQTNRIQGSTWHFFQSPVTGVGGPSQPLTNALQQSGINIIIH